MAGETGRGCCGAVILSGSFFIAHPNKALGKSFGLASVVTVAGEVMLREHPAHGGLVLIRLHEVLPGPAPAQTIDGGQVGPCAVIDGDGTLVKVRVLVEEGADLLLLHAGTEKEGPHGCRSGLFRADVQNAS